MTLLTIFVGIIAFSNLLLLLAIVVLLFAVQRLVTKSLMPAIGEVQASIQEVHKMLERIEGKAEHIMDIGEDTVRKVSGRVVATSDLVNKTVAEPIISLSSVLAGVSKALQTWRQLSSAK